MDPGKQLAVSENRGKKRKQTPREEMKLIVLQHPLIKHWIAILRSVKTRDGDKFKNAMAELGRLIFYEASKDCLLTVSENIKSPIDVASGQLIDQNKPIAIVPILRAGLALAEHAAWGLKSKQTYHLGIRKEKKRRTVYLNMLPDSFPEGSRVFLFDPMLATGATVNTALKLIKERGVDNENIKVISAIVAKDARELLRENFPGLKVYAGAFDEEVNSKGFIVPGLGDAGFRCFRS